MVWDSFLAGGFVLLFADLFCWCFCFAVVRGAFILFIVLSVMFFVVCVLVALLFVCQGVGGKKIGLPMASCCML